MDINETPNSKSTTIRIFVHVCIIKEIRSYNSPLENGLERHMDVPPNFAGSERVKKFVRLANSRLRLPPTNPLPLTVVLEEVK